MVGRNDVGGAFLDAFWHLLLDFFHLFLGGVNIFLCLAPSCMCLPSRLSLLLPWFLRKLVRDGTKCWPFDVMWPSLLPVSLPVLVKLALSG